MVTPSESLTPEERAQRLSDRTQEAATILATVRKELQDFFKAYGITGDRRRINPLGNHAIYYGNFTYSSTYITVRSSDQDGLPYIELSGKSSQEEREELAKHLAARMRLRVTVVSEEQ